MANTLFIGKVYHRFESLASTNDRAKAETAKNKPPEGMVVRADSQSAGRGQFGSHWESEAGANLTLSVVLYPQWMDAGEQFGLGMAMALGVRDAVEACFLRAVGPDRVPDLGSHLIPEVLSSGIVVLPPAPQTPPPALQTSPSAPQTPPPAPPPKGRGARSSHDLLPSLFGEGPGVGFEGPEEEPQGPGKERNEAPSKKQNITSRIFLKWPNDLYLGDRKAGGILIENTLSGSKIQSTIVGIGLNVNQMAFHSDAPNPGSMALTAGRAFDLDEVADTLFECLEHRYLQLKTGRRSALKADYLAVLYRLGAPADFQRTAGGEIFTGIIRGVTATGYLQVETQAGLENFDLKQIRFLH